MNKSLFEKFYLFLMLIFPILSSSQENSQHSKQQENPEHPKQDNKENPNALLENTVIEMQEEKIKNLTQRKKELNNKLKELEESLIPNYLSITQDIREILKTKSFLNKHTIQDLDNEELKIIVLFAQYKISKENQKNFMQKNSIVLYFSCITPVLQLYNVTKEQITDRRQELNDLEKKEIRLKNIQTIHQLLRYEGQELNDLLNDLKKSKESKNQIIKKLENELLENESQRIETSKDMMKILDELKIKSQQSDQECMKLLDMEKNSMKAYIENQSNIELKNAVVDVISQCSGIQSIRKEIEQIDESISNINSGLSLK